MIRRFLGREGRILLEELGAPDARTLLRRVRFWLYTKCGILLGGIAAVEEVFGLAAMWIAVAGVYLFHIWLLSRTGGGGGFVGNAEEMLALMGDSGPSLPPPGKQALPRPRTPQIGRSNQALTKHRPALPKRGPD